MNTSTTATNTDGDADSIIITPRPPRPADVYPPIQCPTGVQGHFPDPYDCSVFHYCNGKMNHVIYMFVYKSDNFLGGVDRPSYCDPGLFWDKS